MLLTKTKQLLVLSLLLSVLISSCDFSKNNNVQNDKRVTKVFYLNSYRSSYSLGKQFTKTIEDRAKENRLKLTLYFLDARISDSPRLKAKKTAEVLKEIDKFKPEVIIVSEDPGIKRVILPNLQQLRVPIIYAGIDWSADSYGFTTQKITGIIDKPALEYVYTDTGIRSDSIKNILVLGGDSEINKRAIPYFDTWAKLKNKNIEYNWTDNIKDWQILFQEAQQKNSLTFLLHEEGIKDWDINEAEYIVSQYIEQPIIALSSTLSSCALYTYAASEVEQANWAMDVALSIYNTKLVKSVQADNYKKFYNQKFIKKLDIKVDSSWLVSAKPVK